MTSDPPWAIGLMSGTSLDGIDAALLRTDGERIAERGAWLTLPYDDAFRACLRRLIAGREDAPAERELTLRHAEAVTALLRKAGLAAADIRVVGFHGQTIRHRPEEKITLQIGDGALLAQAAGIDVVGDFRSADVQAGGQGAPLVPLYHAALAADLPKPAAILNIGGVANVTWIGDDGILAFDTGPGNAPINDAVHQATGAECDEDGKLALSGTPDEAMLNSWLKHSFFAAKPPKSLDRNAFDFGAAATLALPDRVATLTRFTAAGAAQSLPHLPQAPRAWYVCGGGRHNAALMGHLRQLLGAVQPVETLGWEGDALEAQAFAFLAMRHLRGLPLSLPTTTGVPRPMPGGVLHRAG